MKGPGDAVGGSSRRVEDVASGSTGPNLLDNDVEQVVDGDRATVTVHHVARIDTPLISPALPDVVLTAPA